jgi:hypothetical protein
MRQRKTSPKVTHLKRGKGPDKPGVRKPSEGFFRRKGILVLIRSVQLLVQISQALDQGLSARIWSKGYAVTAENRPKNWRHGEKALSSN